MQQVVVRRWEAVDQVEGEAAEEGGEGVQRHPPHLVREEAGGEGAGDEAGVVCAEDGVEEDLLEPHVEVCLGDGHLHPDELWRGVDSTSSCQVGSVCSKLVFVYLDSALVSGGQIYEGSGAGSEEYEVHTDRVDQVEDVDHAVTLLDEEHQVAQDEEDLTNGAVFGTIDKPSYWRHWQHCHYQQSQEEPDQPPAQHHQGEEDGGQVYQIEVDGLVVVAVREPPHRSTTVSTIKSCKSCLD